MPALVRRVTLALLACLLLAPAAAHASWQSVITDCRDGRMDSPHSLKDYTEAYSRLGSDVIEYSDCQSLIRRAQLAAAAAGGSKKNKSTGGGTSSGSGGGSNTGVTGGQPSSTANPIPPSIPAPGADPLATATPVQRAAVTKAIENGRTPVKVGTLVVAPASLGDGSTTSYPPALVVLLLALLVGGIGVGAASVAPHVRARRAR